MNLGSWWWKYLNFYVKKKSFIENYCDAADAATIDNNTKLQPRIYSSESDLLFKYLVRTCRPGWSVLLKLIISAWHWLTFSIAPYLPHVDISHSGLLFSRKRWIKIFDISGSDGRSQGSHQSQVSTSSVRNQGGESCRICSRVQICVYIPHSVSSSSRGQQRNY